MANNIKELLELAADHIDYWEGTLIAKMLEYDIENNDYKSLEEHIKHSAQLMFEHEYDGQYSDYLSDDRAEAMFQEAQSNEN